MIRQPGIDNGAFVVSPDSAWYARVLLLFSASAMTDTGSKTFECALISTLETYDDPDNGNYIHYSNYTYYAYYNSFCHYYNYACYCNYAHYCMFFCKGWLESIGSQVACELDYKKPILYVIPIQSILGKLSWFPWVTLAPSRTTCATHFLALPATAGWVLAMDARCGSSTRGLWDGSRTCNES